MPRLLEEPLAGARIVETLDRLTQTVLGERKTKVTRGDLLDGVRLVEDHEVIGEEIAYPLLLGIAEKGEEESVVEDKHLRRLGATACRLVEAPGIPAAGLRSAEVLLAADLHPELLGDLKRNVAQGSVRSGRRPFADAFEFGALLRCEEISPMAVSACKPRRADIVLPTLQENRLEIPANQSLHQRDVLVEKLLLQVDRVGTHQRLAPRPLRMEDRRQQIGQ